MTDSTLVRDANCNTTVLHNAVISMVHTVLKDHLDADVKIDTVLA
jgi:hypothetical protein